MTVEGRFLTLAAPVAIEDVLMRGGQRQHGPCSAVEAVFEAAARGAARGHCTELAA
jgi:hypothetical protein